MKLAVTRRLGPTVFAQRFLLYCLILSASFGCATTENVYKELTFSKPDLRKRVMVIPTIDLAGIGKERTARIGEEFYAMLEKSPHLVLFRAPDGLNILQGSKSAEFGIITDSQLIKKADELGMNALVSQTLNPINVDTKKTGIWPFRDVAKTIEVSTVINVVDVNSGCLYLTNLISETEVFPLDETNALNEEQLKVEALKKKIPEILKQQASALADQLDEHSWSGKLATVEGDVIEINAGSNVGITAGQVFNVFAQGETIPCKTGNSITILGKKIGQITAKQVMENHTEATVVSGGPFEAGQVIRFSR
jgi:hypothetical protein